MHIVRIVIFLSFLFYLSLGGTHIAHATDITSLIPTSGTVGTEVELEGEVDGGGHRFEVYWDTSTGMRLASGELPVDTADVRVTFDIPLETTKGEHRVILRDAESGTTRYAVFTVEPTFDLGDTSGEAGTEVKIIGKGYSKNETNIRATWDGDVIKLDVTADQNGSWQTTFHVPESSKGTHAVSAIGDITGFDEVPKTEFSVKPALSLNRDGSPISPKEELAVSSKVNIKGTGFASATEITVKYDHKVMETGIPANVRGSFTYPFEIPVSGHGSHQISAIDKDGNEKSEPLTIESTPPRTPNLWSPESNRRIVIVRAQSFWWDLLGNVFHLEIISDDSPLFLEWEPVTDDSGVKYTVAVSSDRMPTPRLYPAIPGSKYELKVSGLLEESEVLYWKVKAIDGADNDSEWTESWALKVGLHRHWMVSAFIVVAIWMLLSSIREVRELIVPLAKWIYSKIAIRVRRSSV